MGKIKIGIVEDEIIIADTISKILETLGYEVIEPVASYREAAEMLETESPDLLLLDIQLKGQKDGIDLAEFINEEYNIPFIFLTANADAPTVDRAKRTNPHAYLNKPFTKDDLYTAIEICLYNFSQKKKIAKSEDNIFINDSIFIKENNYFHKVKYDEIIYIESEHVYINIVTTSRKILVRSSLTNYLENFDKHTFFRIHRSYAVNLQYIKSINTENIILTNNLKLPIGKNYREDLLHHLKLG